MLAAATAQTNIYIKTACFNAWALLCDKKAGRTHAAVDVYCIAGVYSVSYRMYMVLRRRVGCRTLPPYGMVRAIRSCCRLLYVTRRALLATHMWCGYSAALVTNPRDICTMNTRWLEVVGHGSYDSKQTGSLVHIII